MDLGIFSGIYIKTTIQVWSIHSVLEKLTQNPIAGTMLGPGSTCRECKEGEIRTVQLHSISEELKEKMLWLRFRKDIKMAHFVLFKALESKAGY